MGEWDNLRAWENSKNRAFEELCCQLANSERPQHGAEFFRKGTGPDAGIECYWVLDNGDEHGWQAKFFLSPNDVDWAQIDKSVTAAITKHPHLVQYTICLPIDRSESRQRGRKSMQNHWDTHVKKWRGWAEKKQISLTFSYWGQHEIFRRLTQEEHRGRYYFWFNKDLFSDKWFRDQVAVSLEDAEASDRYIPELNVELPIANLFHALGRTEEFFPEIYKLHKDIRKQYNSGLSL